MPGRIDPAGDDPADRLAQYRAIAEALEQAIAQLAACGELLAAAHLQAGLDQLRIRIVAPGAETASQDRP